MNVLQIQVLKQYPSSLKAMRTNIIPLIFSLFFHRTAFAKECEEKFLVFNDNYEKGLAPEGRLEQKKINCNISFIYNFMQGYLQL